MLRLALFSLIVSAGLLLTASASPFLFFVGLLIDLSLLGVWIAWFVYLLAEHAGLTGATDG
jgi:hypothetical protein